MCFEGSIPPPIKSNNCFFFSYLEKSDSKSAAVILFFNKNFSYSILENLFSLLKFSWILIYLLKDTSDSLKPKCSTSFSINLSPIKVERNLSI